MKLYCQIKFKSEDDIIDLNYFFERIVGKSIDDLKEIFPSLSCKSNHSFDDITHHTTILLVYPNMTSRDFSLYSFQIEISEKDYNRAILSKIDLIQQLLNGFCHFGVMMDTGLFTKNVMEVNYYIRLRKLDDVVQAIT